ASDIMMITSLNEGLPRAIPQAMLAKKPAISFDVDGAREVINERTGVLVRPKDIDGLIEAQRRLIPDKALREQMGQIGFDYCSKEFSHELMVQRIEQVYKNSRGQ
ncbi:MAG: glycosyltransferase, partial [Sedimentisphaerales bacterium]|nr:glycosyltransferase [Sedimentisphaerales bacterium]